MACAFLLAAGIAGLGGCASAPSETLPRGGEAYSAFDNAAATAPVSGVISPGDRLDIHVLYEPDLSRTALRVDSAGLIDLPFIQSVQAAGQTPRALAAEIETKLAKFVRQPKVDVAIANAASEHVVVEGSVNDPGVYDIAGSASLLEMLARAKSPNRTANLGEVVVFRTVAGQRMGAVFDVSRIRRGVDPDPTLLPGDMVVVGFSSIKGAYRDFLVLAPTLALFRPY